jgi:hypothetical protein
MLDVMALRKPESRARTQIPNQSCPLFDVFIEPVLPGQSELPVKSGFQ